MHNVAKIDAMEEKIVRPAKIKAINNDEPDYDTTSKKWILTVVSSLSQEEAGSKEHHWLNIILDEKHFSIEQGRECIKLSLEDLRPVFKEVLSAHREESFTPQSAIPSKIPVSVQETLQNFSQDFYIRGRRGQ